MIVPLPALRVLINVALLVHLTRWAHEKCRTPGLAQARLLRRVGKVGERGCD